MKWTNILTKNPLLADITKNLTGWKNGVFPEKSESNKTVNHSPSRNIINTLKNNMKNFENRKKNKYYNQIISFGLII